MSAMSAKSKARTLAPGVYTTRQSGRLMLTVRTTDKVVTVELHESDALHLAHRLLSWVTSRAGGRPTT